MTATPIAQRIPDCPQCGYSWEGLPAAGQCPECGLRFDEVSRQWKPPPPPVWAFIAPLLPLIFVGVLQGFFYFRTAPANRGSLGLVALLTLGLAIASIAGGLYLWRRFRSLGPCACILAEHLYLRGIGRIGSRCLPWREIRKVRVNGRYFMKSIAVHLADATQVDIVGPFRSSGELDEFVKAASGQLARVRSSGDSP